MASGKFRLTQKKSPKQPIKRSFRTLAGLYIPKLPSHCEGGFVQLVRPTGIEPALLSKLEPKSNASASSATGAYSIF